MRIDGLTLTEGSTIQNLSVATGIAFPSSANSGEMFYRTDGANAGMYVYSGSAWEAIATSATSGSVSAVSVNTANGISGTVDTPTTTPAITLSLGAISPTSINASGSVTAGSFVGDGSSITNIASAATLTTGRSISTYGDAVTSMVFDGANNVSAPLILATVNTTPQSDAFQKITVNGKGLVTATSAVSGSDVTTALGYTPVNLAGGTMTGALILNADPVTAMSATTKQYVDNIATGINTKPSVIAATLAALPSCVYNNGTAGVGATLTGSANGAFPSIDGVTVTTTVGQNGVLVKNQANSAHNGRYNLTQLGNGSSPWILTKCALCDTATEIPGSYIFVNDGSQQGTGWVAIVTDPATFVVGTDTILWTQFSGAGGVTAGTGINVASNVISNTGVLSAVAGANISVSSATGNVTIAVTGTVPAATSAGTVTTAAQPTITSVGTLTSITDSGNLTFTGTANRITGDFSNATIANRVTFQTSTVNGGTVVSAIPNGAASSAHFRAYGNSDPTNASFLGILASGVTEARVESGKEGSGTYLPMTFYTGGSERMRIDTSGRVGIGRAATADFDLYRASGTTFKTVANGSVVMQEYASTAVSAGAFGTATNHALRILQNSAVRFVFDVAGNSTHITPTGSLGYGTGSGGTVTQATSKSTAVTLNKPTGQITMNNAELAASTSVTFQVNNSLFTIDDLVTFISPYIAVDPNNYRIEPAYSSDGSFGIRVTNISGGPLSEALVINFAIIKGATV